MVDVTKFSLTEVVSKIRAFVFSSNLGEVTQDFKDAQLEPAIEKALQKHGGGSTDYGQATIIMFPELRTYLENELYEEYKLRGNADFWVDYWPDIFGCKIEDDHYYNC